MKGLSTRTEVAQAKVLASVIEDKSKLPAVDEGCFSPGHREVFGFIKDGRDLIDVQLERPDLRSIIQGIEAAGSVNGEFQLYVDFLRGNLREFPDLSVFGLAERLIRRYGERIRYDKKSRRWMLWSGWKWTEDERGQVQEMAKSIINHLPTEAEFMTEKAEQDKVWAYAKKCQAPHIVQDMLETASTDERIRSITSDYDRDPYVLNTMSGPYDLRSGILLPPSPDMKVSKSVAARFDPEATCSAWDDYLFAWFGGVNELIAYVQRAVGYCLSGSVDEDVIFFLYGLPGAGKTTFKEAIRRLFGDYGMTALATMLMAKRNDSIPTDIADLRGARLVVTDEVGDNRRFNPTLLKSLTGGDSIKARRLYGDYFEFTPTHKIWIVGNSRPKVSASDGGVWRRVNVIPFEHQFSGAEKKDKSEIWATIDKERSGILRWAIDGYKSYRNQGLNPPAIVKCATDAYRGEMDSVQNFIDERCTVRADARTATGDLWKAYRAYVLENAEDSLGRMAFLNEVKAKGYATIEGRSRSRTFQGLELNDVLVKGV